MKKIFFALLISIITISVFGNEKIVDLKFKNDGERKFYPIDENGNMDFGFYKYNVYEELIPPKDETIEPYNGRVDLVLIKELAEYHKKMRWGGLGIGLGMGLGAFFTIGGAGCLYFAFNPVRYDRNSEIYYYINISLGITYLVGGVIELILGSISIGLTAYNGYHYKQTKKEIIKLLNNGNDITSIKTDNFRIRFSFNIDFNKSNLEYFY